MSILESALLVAGATLMLFMFVEYRRDPDIVTVFQKVISLKYLIPLAIIVVAFVILRFILIVIGPLLEFIFRP